MFLLVRRSLVLENDQRLAAFVDDSRQARSRQLTPAEVGVPNERSSMSKALNRDRGFKVPSSCEFCGPALVVLPIHLLAVRLSLH